MTSPVLSVALPDGSRCYRHPITEEMVPSVTTIMRAGIGKPRLTGWSARVAADYALGNWKALEGMSYSERRDMIRYAHDRERDKASELGTAVHNAIDSWVKGEPHEPAKEVLPFLNSFTSFMMDKRPHFIENETTVWSRTFGYAGTLDFIAEIGGKIVLGDFKTGKSVHEEVGLQLAALAGADFIIRENGEEEPIPSFDYLAAVHVRPRSWHLVKANRTPENFTAFLACKTLHDWVNDTAPQVLEAA